MDISSLFYALSGDFAYVVQYSGDNTNNNNVTIANVRIIDFNFNWFSIAQISHLSEP